jgi:phospholipase/carboxylesterase
MHGYDIIRAGADPQDATRVLILLHGRGGSPHDMIDLASQLAGGDWHLAAPRATNATWYPYGFMAPRDRNEPWLSSATASVHRLIGETLEVFPSEKIFLLGFSQGACLAAECAALKPLRYGGIAILTGGLIGEAVDPSAYAGNFNGTPVYLSNSDKDPHVPLMRSKETRSIYQQMGAAVELEIFPGRPHTISQQEIRHVWKMLS